MGGTSAVTAVAARTLEDSIRAQAYGLGFDLVGITTLGSMDTAPHFERWLDRGYAGDMHYLPKWAHKRRDSRLPYEGVRSAIVVAMSYGGREPRVRWRDTRAAMTITMCSTRSSASCTGG